MMDSVKNKVHYCCVSRDNQIVYVYNHDGNREMENLAALCLEGTPRFHKWYFETIGKKTFGFLIEDEYVFFAIFEEGLGNPSTLRFLEHLRDEFKKAARRGSRGSISGVTSTSMQDQLVPVIRQLITSLEHVAKASNDLKAGIPSTSAVHGNEQTDVASSTRAPLLGKSSKQEKKKKAKDHVIAMRDVSGSEEHPRTTDRGINHEVSLDSNNQTRSMSLQKDYSSRRSRSSSQSIEKKWRRQVQIVLAVDAAICLILFGIWLAVCQGIECTRS